MVVTRKMTAPDKNKGHVQNHTTWSTAIRCLVAQRGPTRTSIWRTHRVDTQSSWPLATSYANYPHMLTEDKIVN